MFIPIHTRLCSLNYESVLLYLLYSKYVILHLPTTLVIRFLNDILVITILQTTGTDQTLTRIRLSVDQSVIICELHTSKYEPRAYHIHCSYRYLLYGVLLYTMIHVSLNEHFEIDCISFVNRFIRLV